MKALREHTGLASVEQREMAIIRMQEKRNMRIQWRRYLADDVESGRRVVKAIRPHLEEWLECGSSTTFHTAQMLTDHGCFGGYLRKIGKENTSACHYCGARVDNADHTLSRCTAWDRDRRILTETMGVNLEISRIVKKITESREAWHSFADFCGSVMRRKEEAERIKQGQQQQIPVIDGPTAVPTHRGQQDERRRRGGSRAAQGGQAAVPRTVTASTDVDPSFSRTSTNSRAGG